MPALLPQRDTGHLPDANAADAVNVTVNFQSGGATGFVYDDALAAYGAQLASTLSSSAMGKLPAAKIVNANSANS